MRDTGIQNIYIPGAWNVICDTCGQKKKNFQCTMQMNKEMSNVFVCTDTCLDKHNPQFDVQGIPDFQSVPTARPDNPSNVSGYELAGGAVAPLSQELLTLPINAPIPGTDDD